jgi:hypothetical protein
MKCDWKPGADYIAVPMAGQTSYAQNATGNRARIISLYRWPDKLLMPAKGAIGRDNFCIFIAQETNELGGATVKFFDNGRNSCKRSDWLGYFLYFHRAGNKQYKNHENKDVSLIALGFVSGIFSSVRSE